MYIKVLLYTQNINKNVALHPLVDLETPVTLSLARHRQTNTFDEQTAFDTKDHTSNLWTYSIYYEKI